MPSPIPSAALLLGDTGLGESSGTSPAGPASDRYATSTETPYNVAEAGLAPELRAVSIRSGEQRQRPHSAVPAAANDGTVMRTKTVKSLVHSARMQIVYRGLHCSVKVNEKTDEKTGWFGGKTRMVEKILLKEVHGMIQPSELTFVMGASGAGKTTFLNLLAGHVPPPAKVSGMIAVNGEEMTPAKMRGISTLVHQEDVILDTMTVGEALKFSARLMLPNDMTGQEKDQRALDVAQILGLSKSLDTLVGSTMTKGISGGEKRRVSLGMQMVTNPSILFLDEPTSGLDSFTAYKVCRILLTLAHKYERTIVCTVHQPSSDVFHMADNLIVLANGQVMYHGTIPHMVPYLSDLGYPCPMYSNPADYLFKCVLNAGGDFNDEDYDFISQSRGKDDKEKEDQRMDGLIRRWNEGGLKATMMRVMTSGRSSSDGAHLISSGVSKDAVQKRAGPASQTALLAQRTVRNIWRNPLILKGKLGQTIFLSLVVGLIYLHISGGQAGVQDRQGSLFFLVVQGFFGSVMGVVTVFGVEKAVFHREYGTRMYRLFPYFISRFLVELPLHIISPLISSCIIYWMVGYQNSADKFGWFVATHILIDNTGVGLGLILACIFNDIAVAVTVLPAVVLPLMVFSGFFVNSGSIPPYFVWISYISPMKYGFAALAINEFSGLEITCGPTDECPKDGYAVIDNLELKGSVESNCAILLALAVGFTFLAFIALWLGVRRLQN